MIQVTGDGTQLLVVIGPPLRDGLTAPQYVVTLDAATGAAGPTRRSTDLGLVDGAVIGIASEPRTSRMALLHVTSYRHGMEDNLTRRYDGVSRVVVGERTEIYVAPPGDAPAPSAIAVLPGGAIVLAP